MCLETGFLFLELVTQHQWSSQEHSVPWVYFFLSAILNCFIFPPPFSSCIFAFFCLLSWPCPYLVPCGLLHETYF